MRILVTFAVEAEFAPWRRRWQFVRHASRAPRYRSLAYYSASIGSAGITAFVTGMGLRNSEPGLTLFLEEAADVCICSGLAGGLSPALKAGEVVVAEEVVESGSNLTQSCNRELIEIAAGVGATRIQRILTSKSLLSRAQSKREAAQYAAAVDMESFEIVRKASDRFIPTAVIRSVSDTFDEDLPVDFGRTSNSRGEISLGRVALQLMRRPWQIPAAISFGKQSSLAATKLADFLDCYIRAVSRAGPKKKVAASHQVATT